MGLSIKDIVPREPIKLEDLNGKTVCVDAFNTLYQFLSTIRQPDGTPLMDSNKRITSHLSGIFYRNLRLIRQGLKLIYVFDGVSPELKGKIHKERKESRDEAQKKYEQAREDYNVEDMKKYSSQLTRLDKEMIKESKELLEAMGIMVVQAPSEGEAEAAYLCKNNKKIYSVGSQDYDSLLFGAPRLIQNLTLAKKRKTQYGYVEVTPELITLDNVLNQLEISIEQLICIGILVGTDYNPKGVPGIGQKKALETVKKYKQPVLIFKEVEERMLNLPEEEQFDWKEIFNIFKKHDVEEHDVDLPKIDTKKIKDILVEKHDFSEERVQKQLDRLNEIKEKKKQTGLNKWF